MANIYIQSFKTFFKIGAFTLGGGYAMIPIIEAEVVDKYKWIEKEEFLDLIAIAQSCPGVFAINVSIFIGYKLRKLRGALCTCLGTACRRSSSYCSLRCSSNALRTTPLWKPYSAASDRLWWHS